MCYNEVVLILADIFKKFPVTTIKIIHTRYWIVARLISKYNYWYDVHKNCFVVNVYGIKW